MILTSSRPIWQLTGGMQRLCWKNCRARTSGCSSSLFWCWTPAGLNNKGEGGFNSNNYSIKQKYLEGSNVDSINEIAMMMETVNEFEANQKVIQTIDSILGQIASDIGRVK